CARSDGYYAWFAYW
nr:immunoglobulin heavy chain junction region [Mus musculus]MBK4184681.1 immunoglobulin heavy chain junction region [Mus musculus]